MTEKANWVQIGGRFFNLEAAQEQSIDEQVAEPWAQIGEAQAQDREAIVPKVVFEPKSPGATVGDARKRIMEGKTLPGGFTTFIQKRFEGVK